MDLRRVGWDRILGGALLFTGAVLGTVVGQVMFGRPTPVVGSPDVGIYASDIYLIMAASLVSGWGLPLLFRGRPRRIFAILLAAETPVIVWTALSMARSLPS